MCYIYASIYHQLNKPEKLQKIVDDLKDSIVKIHDEVLTSGQIEEYINDTLEHEAITLITPEVMQV